MEGKIDPVSDEVFDTLCLGCEKVFTEEEDARDICPSCGSRDLVWANEFGRDRFGRLTYISIHRQVA